MNLVSSGLLLVTCVSLSGCGASAASPEVQFQAIVNAKRVQMQEWLVQNKPDLAREWQAMRMPPEIDVTGQITQESSVDLRVDHPYVGTIEVGFPTAIQERSYDFCKLTAAYWFTNKDRQWVFKGLHRQDCRGTESWPLTFEEIEAAYK